MAQIIRGKKRAPTFTVGIHVRIHELKYSHSILLYYQSTLEKKLPGLSGQGILIKNINVKQSRLPPPLQKKNLRNYWAIYMYITNEKRNSRPKLGRRIPQRRKTAATTSEPTEPKLAKGKEKEEEEDNIAESVKRRKMDMCSTVLCMYVLHVCHYTSGWYVCDYLVNAS